MFDGIKARSKTLWGDIQERRHAPPRRRACDCFIVEFPKSGVTWLTQLIANAFLHHMGSPARATFASARTYIPDLSVDRGVEAPQFGALGPAFYKSHAQFNRRFLTSIYLVRHPFDVMQSYRRYRLAHGMPETSLDAFCEHKDYGVDAWRAHVLSWLANGRNSHARSLYLLRYEDLLADTGTELAHLSSYYCWGLSSASIAAAVAASGRDVMQAQEATYRLRNPNHRMSFVGDGQSRETAPAIALRNEVIERCAEELALAGYVRDAAR